MTPLAQQIRYAAQLAVIIRQGQIESAMFCLEQLLESLIPLIKFIPTHHQQKLIQLTELIIQSKQRKDWFNLADYLETDLADFLFLLTGKPVDDPAEDVV